MGDFVIKSQDMIQITITPPAIVPMLMAPVPLIGTGTLNIMLAPNNLSKQTQNGKPILLKGMTFQASFAVQSPAMQPTPAGPVPDPVMTKPGACQFITTNISVQAG